MTGLEFARQVQAAAGTQISLEVVESILNAADTIRRGPDALITPAAVTTLQAKHLDPADLAIDTDDRSSSLNGGDGQLLVVTDYDDGDAERLREVADWWEAAATQITALVDELRDQANAICEACDGAGGWGDDLHDIDCPNCQGTGRVA